MSTFMLTATQLATASATEPTSAAIQAAWTRTPPPEPIYGHWEGTGPRITRSCLPGGVAVTTTVAQPYTFPDGLSAPDLVIFQFWIKAHVNEDLAAVSADFANVVLTPYSASLNGPLAAWQSGAAQSTSSRDACIAGVLTEQDNPAGPVVPPSRPTQTVEALHAAGYVALGVAGIVALVEFGPTAARALGAGQK